MEKLTIRNIFNRSNLGEGRNFGIGFAFVVPTRKNSIRVFKTMQAFTACKDYLNDLVFIEKYNIPLKQVYGFQHTYTGKFKEKDYVYFAIKPLHYNGGNVWKEFGEAASILETNNKNLVKSILSLEVFLNLSDKRTSIYGSTASTAEHTEFVFKIPSEWVERGWTISLYSLWIRCFFNIDKKTAELPFKEMVAAQKEKVFLPGDKYLFKEIEKFIDSEEKEFRPLLDKEIPLKTSSVGTIHNYGIASFNAYNKKPKKNVAQEKSVANSG